MGSNTVGHRGCSCGGSSTASPTVSASASSSSQAGTQALAKCSVDALSGGLARTRFFNGMLLTQTDLESEQRYWKMKRRLTNRALGRGVVWGLQVTFNEALQTFSLSAGYGLDCCGNDLIVEVRHDFGVPYLGDHTHTGVQALLQQAATSPNGITKAALMLQYAEVPECPLPATNGSPNAAPRYEPSRTRETTRLCLAPLPTPEFGIVKLLNELKTLVPGLQGIQNLDSGTDPTAQPYLAETDSAAGNGQNFPFNVVAYAGNGSTQQPLSGEHPGFYAANGAGDNPTIWVSPNRASTQSQQSPFQNVSVFDVVYTHDASGHASLPIQIELVPSGDWMFAAGTVQVNDLTGVAVPVASVVPNTKAGTEAWRMLWNAGTISLPVGSDVLNFASTSEQQPGGEYAATATIASWVLSSLFTGDRFFDPDGTQKIVVQTTVTIDNGNAAPAQAPPMGGPYDYVQVIVRTNVTVSTGVMHEQIYSPENTLPLAPWVSTNTGDPRVAIGSVALALLHAWLSDGLANSAVMANPNKNGQELAAKWLYLTAWQVLTGVDPTVAPYAGAPTRLVDVVEKLFEVWCASLMYPGPHCDETHGIILGTADFRGPSVQLSHFSQWENRRFVVTGALVSHWASSFGIAPPDQIAARLFDIVTRGAGSLKTTTSFTDVDAAKTLMALGNSYFFYGTAADAQAAVQGTIEFGSAKTVGIFDIMALVNAVISNFNFRVGPGVTYTFYSFYPASASGPQAVGIHLFVPDGKP